jgi:hypothetical protein
LRGRRELGQPDEETAMAKSVTPNNRLLLLGHVDADTQNGANVSRLKERALKLKVAPFASYSGSVLIEWLLERQPYRWHTRS